MTSNEKREQAKEIVFQYYEAKKDLEAQKVQAERTAKVFVRIAEALKTDPTLLLDQKWKSETDAAFVANPDFYNEAELGAISYVSMIALATEYQTAKTQMDELAEQKRRLGFDL